MSSKKTWIVSWEVDGESGSSAVVCYRDEVLDWWASTFEPYGYVLVSVMEA